MTNEELVDRLLEYGTEHYKKIENVQDTESGFNFNEFIESLSYTTQRQNQTDSD